MTIFLNPGITSIGVNSPSRRDYVRLFSTGRVVHNYTPKLVVRSCPSKILNTLNL